MKISELLFELCKLICNYSNSRVGARALLELKSIISLLFYYYAHFMAFIPYYGRDTLVCYYFFPGFYVITRIIER